MWAGRIDKNISSGKEDNGRERTEKPSFGAHAGPTWEINRKENHPPFKKKK